MVCFLVALVILSTAGVLAAALGKRPRLACLAGAVGAVAGGAVVLVLSFGVLVSGQSQSLHLAWHLPLASANMEIDPLSAVFAAAIAAVTMLAAVYGSAYLQLHAGRKNLGVPWFFFNLLTAAMLLVVVARNGVLFLVSWELMSLASFFLVIWEDEKEGVRRAAWTYLVAMHLGTAFLLALFLLLGKHAGSLDFERFSAASTGPGILFLLAVIGFGTKAGFIPMHVWLPEAHPAAPAHVSAVMSGVMIKTGIYGLLRILTLLGPPPAWWGWTLVAIGAVSGILGVLYALSQHDLKRLLAYSSVENIGIITMGIGVGILGTSNGNATMAALGFAGALLHVVNHALFKGLLFLGAGSVLHAAGTGELDRLGGLIRRMPVTAAAFLVGAAAISGLPPLNGFLSEFLIYLAAAAPLTSQAHGGAAWPMMVVAVVGSLALIGGLAAACFTRAFGIVFLGQARSDEAAHAHEAPAAMRWPMVVLACLCASAALAAPLWPRLLWPAVAVVLSKSMPDAVVANTSSAVAPLAGVACASYILLGLIAVIVFARRKLLAGRTLGRASTWGCGYSAPTARMQYTASSFARPLTQMFRFFQRPRDEIHPPEGLFPLSASLHTRGPDLFRRYIYEPLFLGIAWLASKLHGLQQGRIQVYVLYIAVTILFLLIWKLG